MLYLLFVSAGLALGVVLGWFGAHRHKRISDANAVTDWQARIIKRLAAVKPHISKKAAGVWVPSAHARFFTRDLPDQSYALQLSDSGCIELLVCNDRTLRKPVSVTPMSDEKIRLYRFQAGKLVQLLLQAAPGDTPAYWVLADKQPKPVSGREFKLAAPRRFKAFLTSPADVDAVTCITAACVLINSCVVSEDFAVNRPGLYYDRWRKKYFAVSPNGTAYLLPEIIGSGVSINVRVSTRNIWRRFKLRIPQACLTGAPAIGSFALLTDFCARCPEDISAAYAKMTPEQQKVLSLAATYAACLMARRGSNETPLPPYVVEDSVVSGLTS